VIGHHQGREVCVMQNAATVLGVLRERKCWATSRTAHAVVTGEPDDRETIKSGSAGGRAEKDQLTRLAPRCAAHPSAWIARHRRCVRDYERLPEHHEAMVRWTMIRITSRRLAKPV
jgi:hypothetical protein